MNFCWKLLPFAFSSHLSLSLPSIGLSARLSLSHCCQILLRCRPQSPLQFYIMATVTQKGTKTKVHFTSSSQTFFFLSYKREQSGAAKVCSAPLTPEVNGQNCPLLLLRAKSSLRIFIISFTVKIQVCKLTFAFQSVRASELERMWNMVVWSKVLHLGSGL